MRIDALLVLAVSVGLSNIEPAKQRGHATWWSGWFTGTVGAASTPGGRKR